MDKSVTYAQESEIETQILFGIPVNNDSGGARPDVLTNKFACRP
jgi:hypothetical protein